jgi:hypothetical protein
MQRYLYDDCDCIPIKNSLEGGARRADPESVELDRSQSDCTAQPPIIEILGNDLSETILTHRVNNWEHALLKEIILLHCIRGFLNCNK